MSTQDPIADMIIRIKNGQMAMLKKIAMPSSHVKEAIAKVLQEEGFIGNYKLIENGVKKDLEINLKYYKGQPVIARIKRISKTGLRIYKAAKDITAVSGFGVMIMTTSKGVMTHQKAKQYGIGGEVLCEVA